MPYCLSYYYIPKHVSYETFRQHLAHYKVPHAFYQVESFPRTGNGKVKRRALTPASGRPLQ